MRADYHLHSEFSDDSHAMMESQIERGIELGLDEMCFTDHVDYGIKQDWDDPGEIGWRGGDGIGTPRTSLEPLTNVHYPELSTSSRATIRKGRLHSKKSRTS